MANKRIFKKSIEAATAQVVNEMMLGIAVTQDEARKDEIEKLIAKMLNAYEVARVQSNVQFDKSPKAFESVQEYHKARRDFYRKMFDRIAADYNKSLNEAYKGFADVLAEGAKK